MIKFVGIKVVIVRWFYDGTILYGFKTGEQEIETFYIVTKL